MSRLQHHTRENKTVVYAWITNFVVIMKTELASFWAKQQALKVQYCFWYTLQISSFSLLGRISDFQSEGW